MLNQPPITIKFAKYVHQDVNYFVADEPSRVNLLTNRALEYVQKKFNSRSNSYASIVAKPPTTLQKQLPKTQVKPLQPKPKSHITTTSTPQQSHSKSQVQTKPTQLPTSTQSIQLPESNQVSSPTSKLKRNKLVPISPTTESPAKKPN